MNNDFDKKKMQLSLYAYYKLKIIPFSFYKNIL